MHTQHTDSTSRPTVRQRSTRHAVLIATATLWLAQIPAVSYAQPGATTVAQDVISISGTRCTGNQIYFALTKTGGLQRNRNEWLASALNNCLANWKSADSNIFIEKCGGATDIRVNYADGGKAARDTTWGGFKNAARNPSNCGALSTPVAQRLN